MTPDSMSAASLCSGYGGLEMGAAMVLPISVRWHAEVDPDASRTLKVWWPDVPNLGDFTTPDFWEHAERVGCELGGIPCQPFSAAGRQAGEDDPRHLWPHWLRGIRRRLPGVIIFENVANLTRGKMRPTFDAVCLALAELGYRVRWCLLGACAVGAAHHRHRVFLVAQRTNTIGSVREVKVLTCGQRGAAFLPTPVVRDATTRGEGSPDYWKAKRATGWTGGITLGAAVTLLPTPRAIDATRGPAAVDRNETQGRKNGLDRAQAVQPALWGKYAGAIARHEAILGRPAPEPTEIGPRGGRRLAAAFSEWLMMLPEGHLTSVLERSPALARAGNGVVPLQAATAIRLLLD